MMLKFEAFFTRIMDVFLRPDYRFIGPGYCEYWYREGRYRASIHFEYLDPSGEYSMVIYMSSVKHWMPPHEKELISDDKRKQIAVRFETYLKGRGKRFKMQ